ncbi:head-tail connector protein [Devosia sp. 2618]|uniref:head-tail connector protein n=1 Tax=Devosia sp. 2618 TaxID=3156454 RepID=UPI0033908DB4
MRHLRLDDDEQREYVEGLVAAATGWLDGPGGWLGRCLGEQTLELVDYAFGNDRLPYPPAIEVVSVGYTDPNGVEQAFPDDRFRLLANGSIWSEQWPALGSGPDPVRVRYRCGYPDRVTPADGDIAEFCESTVPPAIRQAILLLVGQWFRSRENVVVGTIATAMPFAAEALLSPYRVWSV